MLLGDHISSKPALLLVGESACALSQYNLRGTGCLACIQRGYTQEQGSDKALAQLNLKLALPTGVTPVAEQGKPEQ